MIKANWMILYHCHYYGHIISNIYAFIAHARFVDLITCFLADIVFPFVYIFWTLAFIAPRILPRSESRTIVASEYRVYRYFSKGAVVMSKCIISAYMQNKKLIFLRSFVMYAFACTCAFFASFCSLFFFVAFFNLRCCCRCVLYFEALICREKKNRIFGNDMHIWFFFLCYPFLFLPVLLFVRDGACTQCAGVCMECHMHAIGFNRKLLSRFWESISMELAFDQYLCTQFFFFLFCSAAMAGYLK